MNFIYFIGVNRVGKTVLSKTLHDYIGNNSIVMSFGDILRHELIDYYNLPWKIVYDKHIDKNNYLIDFNELHCDNEIKELWVKYNLIPDIKSFDKKVMSLRELMVTHGTHIRRQQNDSYWVEKFSTGLNKLEYVNTIIIDDARYANELSLSHDVVYFWLNNNQIIGNDVTQQMVIDWHKQHNDECIHIDVPIPFRINDRIKVLNNIIIPVLTKNKILYQ